MSVDFLDRVVSDSRASALAGTGTPPASAAAGPAPAGGLLLLEDDEALRQMLEWELTELGYGVLAVGTCREARAALRRRDIELGLFDIGLPDGDGAALAAELVRDNPKLRIVLVTGRPEAPAAKCLGTQILACLTKPVSLRLVDELLRARRQGILAGRTAGRTIPVS